MYRDERYKLVMYHTHDKGELFDLENDPWEFENLWHDADYKEVKHRLVEASFNATMLQDIDLGGALIAGT